MMNHILHPYLHWLEVSLIGYAAFSWTRARLRWARVQWTQVERVTHWIGIFAVLVMISWFAGIGYGEPSCDENGDNCYGGFRASTTIKYRHGMEWFLTFLPAVVVGGWIAMRTPVESRPDVIPDYINSEKTYEGYIIE